MSFQIFNGDKVRKGIAAIRYERDWLKLASVQLQIELMRAASSRGLTLDLVMSQETVEREAIKHEALLQRSLLDASLSASLSGSQPLNPTGWGTDPEAAISEMLVRVRALRTQIYSADLMDEEARKRRELMQTERGALLILLTASNPPSKTESEALPADSKDKPQVFQEGATAADGLPSLSDRLERLQTENQELQKKLDAIKGALNPPHKGSRDKKRPVEPGSGHYSVSPGAPQEEGSGSPEIITGTNHRAGKPRRERLEGGNNDSSTEYGGPLQIPGSEPAAQTGSGLDTVASGFESTNSPQKSGNPLDQIAALQEEASQVDSLKQELRKQEVEIKKLMDSLRSSLRSISDPSSTTTVFQPPSAAAQDGSAPTEQKAGGPIQPLSSTEHASASNIEQLISGVQNEMQRLRNELQTISDVIEISETLEAEHFSMALKMFTDAISARSGGSSTTSRTSTPSNSADSDTTVAGPVSGLPGSVSAEVAQLRARLSNAEVQLVALRRAAGILAADRTAPLGTDHSAQQQAELLLGDTAEVVAKLQVLQERAGRVSELEAELEGIRNSKARLEARLTKLEAEKAGAMAALGGNVGTHSTVLDGAATTPDTVGERSLAAEITTLRQKEAKVANELRRENEQLKLFLGLQGGPPSVDEQALLQRLTELEARMGIKAADSSLGPQLTQARIDALLRARGLMPSSMSANEFESGVTKPDPLPIDPSNALALLEIMLQLHAKDKIQTDTLASYARYVVDALPSSLKPDSEEAKSLKRYLLYISGVRNISTEKYQMVIGLLTSNQNIRPLGETIEERLLQQIAKLKITLREAQQHQPGSSSSPSDRGLVMENERLAEELSHSRATNNRLTHAFRKKIAELEFEIESLTARLSRDRVGAARPALAGASPDRDAAARDRLIIADLRQENLTNQMEIDALKARLAIAERRLRQQPASASPPRSSQTETVASTHASPDGKNQRMTAEQRMIAEQRIIIAEQYAKIADLERALAARSRSPQLSAEAASPNPEHLGSPFSRERIRMLANTTVPPIVLNGTGTGPIDGPHTPHVTRYGGPISLVENVQSNIAKLGVSAARQAAIAQEAREAVLANATRTTNDAVAARPDTHLSPDSAFASRRLAKAMREAAKANRRQ